MKYYIPIKRFSFKYKYFMYVDVNCYLADTWFRQQDLHIKFLKEFARQDSDAAFILCKVPKDEEDKFKTAIAKLPTSFSLMGIDIDAKIGGVRQVLEDYWREHDDGAGSSECSTD